MFTLENVRVNTIIDVPNLTIHADKVMAIIGPSGSGKSTLLRLLNHLQSPDEGEVRYNEQLIDKLEPTSLRRQVVMVPQSPLIFDGTIADNLQIGREFAELPRGDESEMKRVLEVCHLQKAFDRNAKKLSGGEKQRLSLARSLFIHPKVLLLDEPTSALDHETANSVIESIFSFAKEKEMAIVMVTHDRTIAEKYADKIIDISEFSLSLKEGQNNE